MSKKFVLIQARTNSQRFFGKCLLKIKKQESIIFLYNRLKSKEYETYVLTSDNAQDNYLAELLKKNKIKFFRGSLQNVSNRFLQFSKKLNQKDILVRCTADNLILDKFFIKKLIYEFQKSKKDYLKINRKKSRLPYGLAAEVFTVKSLKKYKAKNKFDEEHVTPPIKRGRNIKNLIIKSNNDLYKYRCTIDTVFDYFYIKYLFEELKNSKKTKWSDLCKDLKKIKKETIEKKVKKVFSKLIIGTAQFMGDYGINNKNIINKEENIKKILDFAYKNNINFLDTAQAYYPAEKKIGKFIKRNRVKFKIISKFNLSNIHNLRSSLKKLNQKKIFGMLIHDPSEVHENNLEIIKKQFIYNKPNFNFFGASMNSPNEYKILKKLKLCKIFQIPYNLIDNRWENILNKESMIHVRSVFLQGLLISNQNNCPKNLLDEFNVIKKKLNFLVKKFSRYDTKDLLFNFVKSNKKVDKIIIGFDNLQQIEQILFYMLREDFNYKEINFMKRKIGNVSLNFKCPTNWKN